MENDLNIRLEQHAIWLLKEGEISAFYKERKLLRDENEKLTAALKVAEDAIEREMRWRTVKYCTNDGLDNLGEALNEIQKIKKGLG